MFGWFRKHIRKISIFGVEVEFHPPTNTAAPEPTPVAPRHDPEPLAAGIVEPQGNSEGAAPPSEELPGMTFDAVVQALFASHPEAVLGRTAEQGQYFERAKRLTNYRRHKT